MPEEEELHLSRGDPLAPRVGEDRQLLGTVRLIRPRGIYTTEIQTGQFAPQAGYCILQAGTVHWAVSRLAKT